MYLAIAAAIVYAIVLNKTRVGLHCAPLVRARLRPMQRVSTLCCISAWAILAGSAITGFGGFYYIMDYIKGSWENTATIEAFAWLAIALVIFVFCKPDIGVFDAVLVGASYIVAFMIPNIPLTQSELTDQDCSPAW